MNKSILFGRLVKDPDIRYTQTQSGELAIANFRIAVNRKYAKENGPNADFFTCTAFGKKAEFVSNYFAKGAKIAVEGRMENDNYENNQGEKVYSVRLMVDDVDFVESKGEEAEKTDHLAEGLKQVPDNLLEQMEEEIQPLLQVGNLNKEAVLPVELLLPERLCQVREATAHKEEVPPPEIPTM